MPSSAVTLALFPGGDARLRLPNHALAMLDSLGADAARWRPEVLHSSAELS